MNIPDLHDLKAYLLPPPPASQYSPHKQIKTIGGKHPFG